MDPSFDKVHSAIFPVELCKRVIQYYSYKGDLIFDPFAGTGTVGRVAKALGRLFFLTEQESKYVEYMKLKQKDNQLFNESKIRFLTLEQFKNLI
ncbi:MAG: site-specific DNA-methyltransferase [Planctomycetaceae bacterium]|nr:site-specific DNA-methyltransferase [Planctomycetaceae bacterium]